MLLVIANLGVATEGEVFPQRMTVEAIVSQNTAKVRMIREENAVEVPGFPLIPRAKIGCYLLERLKAQTYQSAPEKKCSRAGHAVSFASTCLDADAATMLVAK